MALYEPPKPRLRPVRILDQDGEGVEGLAQLGARFPSSTEVVLATQP